MSEPIRRKSSSKQLLQNLISLTAQRSQEDAEEVERERRRRARETQRGEGSPSWPEPPQHNPLTHRNTELDEELKPRCCLVLEEDEGFSDWSHRLEGRNEQEVQDDCRARVQRPSTQQWKPEPGQEKQQQGEEDEKGCEPERSSRSQEALTRPPEKMSSNRYSSTVFLSQDARLQHAMGQPADRTSYLVAGTMRPRGGACRVDGEVEQQEQKEDVKEMQATLQGEWTSAESRQSPRDKDDQEEEELSFTNEEKDDLHLRREERHKEEEGEEHKMPDKSSMEGRRSEEVSRRSATSRCSSSEGEELLNYGPMSPTFKKLLIQFYPDEVNSRVSTDGKCTIIERTESLRKSTSNIKKTLPPVAVSKIDKKLEQYTHALEVSSKEGRSASQLLPDLMSPTEAVSSKKSLFEAGEAWNQNAITVTPSKDADGLKVGVADLINQWVKGSEDGSRCSSPSRPADMKPGGVSNKKNLWVSLGDTLSSGREGKESSTAKRYKFVVTGHGKYEKVYVDNDCSEDANCQSAGQFYDDL
ncbi:non-muscle caldesmon-like isoform X1 [Sander lucioperca]|uniref:non-muscle caldesmon-like isoform X1 n=1 Tax=Sander lucioperca TaxID=283035 RepID=UPI001653D2D5|nr:non-muscle caldesmon-like isoform X1 [Sander lucioperca]